MANALAITLNALTANDSIAAPTAQILDTGTADVVLESAVTSELDRVIFEVTNTAAEALEVIVSAGEDPPAFRKSLGALTTGTLAQNERRIFGPFESARVIQADGKLQVTFAPGGTIAATFVAYVLPKV